MNRTIATSLTTAVFLIISISGTMMFFHFFDSSVKSLHEFLGLAFVVTVIFHLFYNWKSMKTYFKKKTFISALSLGLIVTTIFILNSSNQKVNPKRNIISSVLNAPLEQSYKILNIKNPKERLKEAGIEVFEETSITQIAKANGKNPFELVNILTSKK